MVTVNPVNQGTSTTQPGKYTAPTLSPQKQCELSGGTWDAKTQTCISGKLQDVTPKAPPQAAPPKNTSFYTGQEGGITGIEKGGKTYLGKISPEEAQNVMNIEAAQQLPQGAVTVQQQAQQRQAQAVASQVGQVQPQAWAPQQQAPIDWGQALTAGAISGAPQAIGAAGALIGAGAGLTATGVGAPVGLAAVGIGAALWAVQKIWSGTASNIKSQQRGEIGASQDVLTNAKTNMRQLAMLASQDPANAGEYIQAYNAQLTLVYQARNKIKAETQGNLNKFMEDGNDILSDFDLFLGPDGTAEIYRSKLRVALSSGVPIPLTEGDLPE